MKASENVNLREIVLDILLENEKNAGHSHTIIRQALDKFQYLDKTKRAFVTKLAKGTVERQLTLDWYLNQVSKVRIEKMKPVIRGILRMAAFQILYMDSVPVSAVCNEAVRLAKKRGFTSLSGFVNGVLRTLSRTYQDISLPLQNRYVEFLSVKYAMPEWLIRHFLDTCGRDAVEGILDYFNRDTVVYIRCNPMKIRPEKLRERLISEDVTVTDTVLPFAFAISGYDSLNAIPSFQKGLFAVQDLSSILQGVCINPKPGDYVVDVCAAPGGKCLHIAQKEPHAQIDARDISERKLCLIEDNMRRMGSENVSVQIWDAAQPDERIIGKADYVIADVPCSGLGVLGRKPDLRYSVTKDRLDAMISLQREILKTCASYVKPGGYLIYSTCTINPGENADNVQWFLEHFSFSLVDLSREYPMLAGADKMVTLIPGNEATDGFFIAKLRKQS